jgi:drug/metabolite transporter (DMT)-like permease
MTLHDPTKDFPMQSNWLTYTLITTLLWGVWGAFTGLPAEHGFPDTLIYVVWALTMVVPGLIVLARHGWRLDRDRRSVVLGLAVGLLGAGGQMLLFRAVQLGPAYLVFPIVSLSPAITIALSFGLLGERTGKLGMAGIALALCSLPLFDLQFGQQGQAIGLWFVLALAVLVAWGLQAYFIKLANAGTSAESIFFYMAVGALACVPFALWMTDFSQPIHWGWQGPGLAAAIQVLNAIGALTLVYAFRYGKALVVSPLVNAGAPLLTAVLSMALSGAALSGTKLLGVALALLAALLLALQPETPSSPSSQPVQGDAA